MWATLVLSAAVGLGPAQAPGLEVDNARFTQGVLGRGRKDNKFLPGDVALLAFDVRGLKTTGVSRVRFALGLQLSRKGASKPEFTKEPEDEEAVLALGGDRLTLSAAANVGTETEPGQYVMKVTVTDRVGKGAATVEREFEVLRPRLGFVRVGLSYGAEHPAPAVAVPGQTLFLNFGLVGFALDKVSKRPDMTLELRVVDEKGKPTTSKPFRGDVRKMKAGFERFIPFDPIAFQAHRAGKYSVTLKVTDNVTGKSAEHSLALTVLGYK
jgi:hypothetical protein